jgi:hypothetical protein
MASVHTFLLFIAIPYIGVLAGRVGMADAREFQLGVNTSIIKSKNHHDTNT